MVGRPSKIPKHFWSRKTRAAHASACPPSSESAGSKRSYTISTGSPSIATKSIALLRRASIQNGLLTSDSCARQCDAVTRPRGAELFAFEQIGFAEDAYQIAVWINHRKSAYIVLD
jgi:hypothetical protein